MKFSKENLEGPVELSGEQDLSTTAGLEEEASTLIRSYESPVEWGCQILAHSGSDEPSFSARLRPCRGQGLAK
jgi:hypothetical protein